MAREHSSGYAMLADPAFAYEHIGGKFGYEAAHCPRRYRVRCRREAAAARARVPSSTSRHQTVQKIPAAIQAVMDKLRREGFQVAPYNSPQPSTPNRVRTSLKMILVNGALCTIQVRPAFKFRPNGCEYARLDVGRDIKRAKAALFAVCKRPHNETRRHSLNSFAKDFVCIYSC
jgi:hypothetical protein